MSNHIYKTENERKAAMIIFISRGFKCNTWERKTDVKKYFITIYR